MTLFGCGRPKGDVQSARTDVRAIYNQDVTGLHDLDSRTLRNFDERNNGIITRIFGGPLASDVLHYYNDRVHYVFTVRQLAEATLTPTVFPICGWLTPLSAPECGARFRYPSSFNVGATNVSALLWLQGEVNRSPVTLTMGNEKIPIDSTRTGVIMLGNGYMDRIPDGKGGFVPIPAAYRQSILLHEARHSDCTGGLSEADLAVMRNAASAEEFDHRVRIPHCGHIHIVCQSGTYKGIAACDAERFGAYGIGAIYEKAMIGAQTDDVARKILQESALDNFSRYTSRNSDDPAANALDMSSEGLVP